jgi:hypothetical protein
MRGGPITRMGRSRNFGTRASLGPSLGAHQNVATHCGLQLNTRDLIHRHKTASLHHAVIRPYSGADPIVGAIRGIRPPQNHIFFVTRRAPSLSSLSPTVRPTLQSSWYLFPRLISRDGKYWRRTEFTVDD